ncbi:MULTISPECIES: HXXEE domain-containing protein [Streptomyces]|uniref:Integral membrane protein n=1 Tax=Streptomyces griseus TaxID=1911 RepID=A0A380P3V7_STRGR|nr:HXXEE domain-containing protein [Streptomyces griseus]SUP59899.1 Integral membrane protein [Streptomyces griseus]
MRTRGNAAERVGGGGGEEVPGWVTLGLLGAWVVHDAEELLAARYWIPARVPELRERFPQVPDRLWREMAELDVRRFGVAVGCVGLVVAAAAVEGRRTGGRSAVYQSVLDGFGLHGLVHLAQATAVRGYTPGVATTPLLVLPFTLAARARLRRAGLLRPARSGDALLSLGLAEVATAGAHLVARRLTARGRG